MTAVTASLRTIARRALGGEVALARGSIVVVAVSGGPDSMALLDVLADLAPSFALEVHAHGVDHGLRAEAADELARAEALARARGVPFATTRVDVPRGGNLQARARTARWEALVAAATRVGARAVATAHHADDRAETVLLRLLRGAGARGLAAMPSRAPAPGAPLLEVVRPLLRARRKDVLTHLRRRAIAYASDPSNDDPRFLRVRVRRELLPLLEELDPSIVLHLEALADELEAINDRGAAVRPDEHVDDKRDAVPEWTAGLPRRTQLAIRALVRSRSRSARVWLPGGLVVSLDERARSPKPVRSKT